MPSTLAIINEYYIGKERQRAVSYWSIGSWGGSGIVHYLVVSWPQRLDGSGFLLFQLHFQF